MSSFLKPSTWFHHSRRPVKDQQSGVEQIGKNTVVNFNNDEDADGFTPVEVRPMTYAEASCTVFPAADAKVSCAEAYSPIDDSRLALQYVEQFESQAQKASKSPVSTHVLANIEVEESYHEKRTRRRHPKSAHRSRRASK